MLNVMALGKIDDIFRGGDFFVQKSRKGNRLFRRVQKLGGTQSEPCCILLCLSPLGTLFFASAPRNSWRDGLVRRCRNCRRSIRSEVSTTSNEIALRPRRGQNA